MQQTTSGSAAATQPDERNLSFWFSLIDEGEAARFLDVSIRHVQGLRYKGGGPRFVKLGRIVRYRRQDLNAWSEAQLRQSTADTGRGGETNAR
mgnify:CR=1 FL=1